MAKKNQRPSWRYGPDGQSRIFNEGDTIPKGWADHPSKVSEVAKVETIEQIEAAYAAGTVTLEQIEAAEKARPKPRQGVLTLIENERARIDARGEALTMLRGAGVEISELASDEELDAALAALEDQNGED